MATRRSCSTRSHATTSSCPANSGRPSSKTCTRRHREDDSPRKPLPHGWIPRRTKVCASRSCVATTGDVNPVARCRILRCTTESSAGNSREDTEENLMGFLARCRRKSWPLGKRSGSASTSSTRCIRCGRRRRHCAGFQRGHRVRP